jgi:prepilin-type N-terminal cleavage/methylation domain-containing protein
MTRRPAFGPSPTRRRHGFSMIELLIVITIIAILVSLLLVGVQGAVSRARVAAVVAEIKNLEQAIQQFKAEFGTEPPSHIVLYEETTSATNGWNTAGQETRTSRSIIRQLWKDYDFATAVDINHDGDTSDTIRLTGAECLVFFLGGVTSLDGTTVTCKGFSKVPSAPFTSLTGARSGPYYEFKPTQLIESTTAISGSTNNRMYVYIDSIPGQARPIQYFSSYGGAGYRIYGLNGTLNNSATSDDEVIPSTMQWVYTKSAGSSTTAGEVYNPNTFQLISPGLDGEYGPKAGGHVHPENGVQTGTMYFTTAISQTKDAAEANPERDNITNFAGGEIH